MSSPVTSQTTADDLAIVLFGKDEAGKAHASSFTTSEVGLATKAAGLMGMRLMPITNEAQRALSARVPKGRVFSSGKGFVPFVAAGLFAELEAAAPPPDRLAKQSGNEGTGEPAAAAHSSGKAAPVAAERTQPVRQPSHWGEIQVGAIVLARPNPDAAEWYEVVVVAIGAADRFTLRYADWPDEPLIEQRRAELGIMHPLRQPEPALEPETPAPAVA